MRLSIYHLSLASDSVRPESRMFRLYNNVDALGNRIGMGSYIEDKTPEGLRVFQTDAQKDGTGKIWQAYAYLVDDKYNVRYVFVPDEALTEKQKFEQQARAIQVALTAYSITNARSAKKYWHEAAPDQQLHYSTFNTGHDFQSVSRENAMEIQVALASSNPHDAEDALVVNHPVVVALFAGSGVSFDRDSRGRWYLSGRRSVLVSHNGKEYTVRLVDGAKEAIGSATDLKKAIDTAGAARFKKRKDL